MRNIISLSTLRYINVAELVRYMDVMDVIFRLATLDDYVDLIDSLSFFRNFYFGRGSNHM